MVVIGPEYLHNNKTVAKAVLLILEDKRLLDVRQTSEDARYCMRSAQNLRGDLTLQLLTVQGGGPLEKNLKELRQVCRAFVSAAGPDAQRFSADFPLFQRSMEALHRAFAFRLYEISDLFQIGLDGTLSDLVRRYPPH